MGLLKHMTKSVCCATRVAEMVEKAPTGLGCDGALPEDMVPCSHSVLNESFPGQVPRLLWGAGNYQGDPADSSQKSALWPSSSEKPSRLLKVTYFGDPFNSSMRIFGCVAQKSIFETNTMGYVPKKFKKQVIC